MIEVTFIGNDIQNSRCLIEAGANDEPIVDLLIRRINDWIAGEISTLVTATSHVRINFVTEEQLFRGPQEVKVIAEESSAKRIRDILW
jgi:hypothetical protein